MVDADAYAAFVDCIGQEYATEEGFEEAYCGEVDSEVEYAEQLIDEIGGVEPGSLSERYFDYIAFANDLFMDGYFSAPAPGGRVYVFQDS